MGSEFDIAAEELRKACNGIEARDMDDVVERIAGARNIIVYGCGRERLQLMGFAMRLFHLGRKISVVGDMTTPPAGKGDLFLATVGPGQLATAEALLRIAKEAGASTLVITAQASGRAAKLADEVLVIPAQTMANDRVDNKSLLPMGSVFEGALFLLFEVLVLKLQKRLGVSFETMRANHTNLE